MSGVVNSSQRSRMLRSVQLSVYVGLYRWIFTERISVCTFQRSDRVWWYRIVVRIDGINKYCGSDGSVGWRDDGLTWHSVAEGERWQQYRLNFTRIFTWEQYFIEHLMLGHVPSLGGHLWIKVRFKDFFLIPPASRIRNTLVPRVEYLTWYLHAVFLISRFSLPLSPLSGNPFPRRRFRFARRFSFQRGSVVFIHNACTWTGTDPIGNRSHLKLETRLKRSRAPGCVTSSRVLGRALALFWLRRSFAGNRITVRLYYPFKHVTFQFRRRFL